MINRLEKKSNIPFPLLLEKAIMNADKPAEEKEEVLRRIFRSRLEGQKDLSEYCAKCAVT